MRPLRTVDEHRLGIINRHIERLHSRLIRAHRHEARMNTRSRGVGLLNRHTWFRERRLSDRMVDLRELELNDISWLRGDLVGSEDQRLVECRRADHDSDDLV